MSNAERAAYYDEMNRVIAQLHTVDYAAIGLETYGKPGNYFGRQIERWSKQYKASETETIAAMDNLIEWLPKNIPPGDETSIVHGDYRMDNMMFHPTEPKVAVAVDYGHTIGSRPARGTLTGFREGRQVPPVPDGTRGFGAVRGECGGCSLRSE